MHTKRKLIVSISNLKGTDENIRAVALWNAADGMPTEEAVKAIEHWRSTSYKGRFVEGLNVIVTGEPNDIKEAVRYLEHGREMEIALKLACIDCERRIGKKDDYCPVCKVQIVLAKLEGK